MPKKNLRKTSKKPNGKIKYISLQEATRYCNYSQEYLSLRARQGKLKSKKQKRNWVTTKEWLKEYIAKVEEYNNQIQRPKKKKLRKPIEAGPLQIKYKKKAAEVGPLQAVPASEAPIKGSEPDISKESKAFKEPEQKIAEKFIDADPLERFLEVRFQEKCSEREKKTTTSQFMFIFGLTLILLIFGAFIGESSLEKISAGVETIGKTGDIIIAETVQGLADISKSFSSGLDIVSGLDTVGYIYKYTIMTFGEYFQWLGGEIKGAFLYIYNIGGKGVENTGNGLKTIFASFVNFFKFTASLIQPDIQCLYNECECECDCSCNSDSDSDNQLKNKNLKKIINKLIK